MIQGFTIIRSEKSVNIQILSRATVHCSQQSTQKLKKGAKQPMTQIKQITPSHYLANNSGKLALSYNYPSHTLSHSRVQPYIIIPPKIHHQSLLKDHPVSSRSDHRYYDPFSFPLSP